MTKEKTEKITLRTKTDLSFERAKICIHGRKVLEKGF